MLYMWSFVVRSDLLVTTGELSTGALLSALHYFIADRVEYFWKH
jgi:hypothetical protein